MLGFVCISVIMPSSCVVCVDKAICATSSASEFFSRSTWMNLTSSKWLAIWMASLWYFYIHSSFASYSWFTYPTINLKSLFITKFLAPKALASLKLVSIASYVICCWELKLYSVFEDVLIKRYHDDSHASQFFDGWPIDMNHPELCLIIT